MGVDTRLRPGNAPLSRRGLECLPAMPEETAGRGSCNRCEAEDSPHPCPFFLGEGSSTSSICQRNWCAHNWGDHA